jgi:hypothetical protein
VEDLTERPADVTQPTAGSYRTATAMTPSANERSPTFMSSGHSEFLGNREGIAEPEAVMLRLSDFR